MLRMIVDSRLFWKPVLVIEDGYRDFRKELLPQFQAQLTFFITEHSVLFQKN